MQFPPPAAGAQAGDVALVAGVFKLGDTEHRADYGTLTVAENRETPGGRRIELPVVRIRSTDPQPGEPIFLLQGGPGISNIWSSPPAWMLDHHDVVMVGYRGVDGSVSLDCPEVDAAMGAGRAPLSAENLARVGDAFRACHQRLTETGVDVDRYSMIDVIDDMEDARAALGYEVINLYGESYGTRVAYLYSLRYPDSLERSLMVGVNPPGHFIWEAEAVDRLVTRYAALWAQDPVAAARTPDLEQTIKSVLATLPRRWLVFEADPDKVRAMTFMMLYHRDTAVQVLDALVAAEERDDYSGLALLSFFFGQLSGMVNWGDNVAKAMSADYEPTRDYWTEMMPSDAVLGSPFSQMLHMLKDDAWPMEPIPEEYRRLRVSTTETLMVNGDLDISTPVRFARDELLPNLPNGSLVVVPNVGHVNDVLGLQPDAYEHLARGFFRAGAVDDSKFTVQPISFTPAEPFGAIARRLVRWAVLILAGALLLLAAVAWLSARFWRRRRGKRREREGGVAAAAS
ncbi:MAG: alpha/beta fold hydrolase [Planctomycetota bacterium]